MNRAKYVSNFLLCGINNVAVEYSGVEIKACTVVLSLLRAGNNKLQGMALPDLLTWIPCLIRSGPQKDTRTGFLKSFSKIFY